MLEELQNEAASQIQDFVRTRVLHGGQSSSEVSTEQPDVQPCSRCGLDVIMDGTNADGDYECDMCDRCDAVLHSRCLVPFINIHGEWSLCQGCLHRAQHGGGLCSIQCDLRTLPSAAWNNIYKLFSNDTCELEAADPLHSRGTSTENPSLRPGAAAAVTAKALPIEAGSIMSRKEEDIFKPLDSTLDFIVRFLEGEHTKSEKITQSMRESILKAVRSAMAWRRHDRSQEAVQHKVEELNTMMSRIVNQL